MALLASKTFSTTEGASSISIGSGIGVFSILSVRRSGLQHDKVLNASLNDGVTRQWALDQRNRRIKFPSAIPFTAGEKVFVLYKSIV